MEEKKYIRDGRSPIPSKSITSKVMSAIRSKNTKPELILRKALWNLGIRGYRLHLKNLEGRPDISFSRKKVAIFVNGCFWHRCPYCNLPLPKENTGYWENKFFKNQERDIKKRDQLISLGWEVIVFWECEIKKNLGNCIKIVIEALDDSYS